MTLWNVNINRIEWIKPNRSFVAWLKPIQESTAISQCTRLVSKNPVIYCGPYNWLYIIWSDCLENTLSIYSGNYEIISLITTNRVKKKNNTRRPIFFPTGYQNKKGKHFKCCSLVFLSSGVIFYKYIHSLTNRKNLPRLSKKIFSAKKKLGPDFGKFNTIQYNSMFKRMLLFFFIKWK